MTNSDVEIAWAAGWFEGEGCISGSGDATIHVLATSTDLDVLTRFAQIVGVGRIVKSKDQPGRKPKWDWYVTAGDAVEVLRAFLPYLGERRRARAVEKIDARERFEAMVSAPRVCPGCGEEFIPERPKSTHAGSKNVTVHTEVKPQVELRFEKGLEWLDGYEPARLLEGPRAT